MTDFFVFILLFKIHQFSIKLNSQVFYKIKNDSIFCTLGANSVFMDMQFEAEESGGQDGRTHSERRAGLVFGLTYSPHFTVKVELYGHQFSAFAEGEQ